MTTIRASLRRMRATPISTQGIPRATPLPCPVTALATLIGDDDALPERDVTGDLRCGLLGSVVVPCGIRIDGVSNDDVEVRGVTLPGAHRRGGRVPVKLWLDRVSREVVVALDYDGVVGFGNDRIVPRGLHGILLAIGLLVSRSLGESTPWRPPRFRSACADPKNDCPHDDSEHTHSDRRQHRQAIEWV